jgi:hypothetical protein
MCSPAYTNCTKHTVSFIMREKIVHPAVETTIFIAMKRKIFLPELDCIVIFSNKKLIYVYVLKTEGLFSEKDGCVSSRGSEATTRSSALLPVVLRHARQGRNKQFISLLQCCGSRSRIRCLFFGIWIRDRLLFPDPLSRIPDLRAQ